MVNMENSAPEKPIDSSHWVIHGKEYDFSSFVDSHPGGREMILLGKGRDCTELFESVHSLSKINPKKLLKKYEVKDQKEEREDMFKWEESGFYCVLKDRVKEYFQNSRKTYKATVFYYVKVFVLFAIYFYFLKRAVLNGSYLSALAAGLLIEMLGFCVMHDGSHGAISKKSGINKAGCLLSCWFLWDHWIWLRHHTYAHHSFTGINKRDPDLNNSKFFIRKHPEGRWKKMFLWQHVYVWPLMILFPNQHVGQALQYLVAEKRHKIFGVPLEKERSSGEKSLFLSILSVSLLVHVVIPLLYLTVFQVWAVNFLIWTMAGLSYFAVVAPNHDTEDVANNYKKTCAEKMDWGELQVRNSCDHSTKGSLLDFLVTHLWGGMNYQIEHHLFPAMCHVHYSEVSKIVERTTKEFGIPYSNKNSWADSMKSFYRVLQRFGKRDI